MENGPDEDTRGLKKVDREVRQWSRKVNQGMENIKTETITNINKLIRAVSIYTARKMRLRTETQTRNRRGELKKKEKYNELARKYKIRRKRRISSTGRIEAMVTGKGGVILLAWALKFSLLLHQSSYSVSTYFFFLPTFTYIESSYH